MRIFPLGIAMMLSAVLACGGGKKEPTPPAPAPVVSNAPPAEGGRVMAPPPDSETGAPECDELVRRQRCLFTKSEMPAEAKQSFEDSLQAWRDALADERSRMAMIDGCKQSIVAADEGLKSMGC